MLFEQKKYSIFSVQKCFNIVALTNHFAKVDSLKQKQANFNLMCTESALYPNLFSLVNYFQIYLWLKLKFLSSYDF